MRAVKYIINFFAFLFTLLLGLLILTFVGILMTRSLISYDNMYEYVNDSNVFECKNCNVFANNNNSSLKDTISADLYEFGISPDVTAKVLSSSDINVVMVDYIYDNFDSVIYDKQYSSFDVDRLVSIVETEYALSNGISLNDDQKQQLSDYFKSLIERINLDTMTKHMQDDIGDFKNVIKIANSDSILVVVVVSIFILFVIVLMCLSSFVRAFRCLGIVFVVDGLIIIAGGFLEVNVLSMNTYSKSLFNNLILAFVENGFRKSVIFGSGLIIIGIIILIICAIIIKNMKKVHSTVIPGNAVGDIAVNIEPVNNEDNSQNVDGNIVSDNNLQLSDNAIKNDVNGNNEVNGEISSEEGTQKGLLDVLLSNQEKKNVNDYTELVDDNSNLIANEVENEVPITDTIELEDSVVIDATQNIRNNGESNISSKEINDSEEEIVKKDLNLKPLEQVSINITSPIKGKDVNPILEESDDEEEIEIL